LDSGVQDLSWQSSSVDSSGLGAITEYNELRG